ncbi:hypothetical protein SMACR_07235 [Sordaria macrospora]|uniref:WGS project CABT00000000 data, contig 2.42 n=2 Tax=Sordaria macrospora TaxID=5147 RepID=F7W824_SORMK|nr:uncharacterized protein SMAC_07235 [Sordaria macrospora k-hell]KAA8631506.1 hypothetical protein SMACR_07235 [Sordaria macrospora]KAH7635696.1 hypothetical protein B0T09DRAFT_27001 [Sordaria sp. MPI-SDFR-AT-0083]WPJ64190.1 hypothetical protein SMAC4_07235 [Sordaria macrospora]CCC13669.1 unnamed protein product [Sordaria macrospora k-hell]
MSNSNQKGWLRKLIGRSKKSNSDLTNQHQGHQPISPAHDALASNNPFASSEAAPPSYNEAMSGKPGASANGNQLGASSSQDPGAATTYRRVTWDGQVVTAEDDPYAFLSVFDTVFLIDDSGSMSGPRWSEAGKAIAAIAPICVAHDKDGIDVHFINHPHSYTNITSAARVNEIFSEVKPRGVTLTGQRLWDILGPYLERYTEGYEDEDRKPRASWDPEKTGVKPMNLIVITDGEPDDSPEMRIKQCIKRLEKVDAPYYQIGIQFFQVGNDKEAKKALAALDDNLGDDRDMVDTVTWDGGDTLARQLEGDKLLKVVLGSVVKRLDRQKADGKDTKGKKK